MLRKLITLSVLLISFTGCHRAHQSSISRFHDDGRAKIAVLLTPVYDRNQVTLPWSLAEDLTETIQSRLGKSGSMYLIANPKPSLEDHLASGENPFIGDFSWMKKVYERGEFVVFLELVDHNLHPKAETGSFFDKIIPSYALDVTMRVRIIDLRSENPQIVLQEIIHQTHLIPKQFAKLDYAHTKWGKKTYAISPLGLAHSQLSKEVSKRIEDYVLLAKSKSYVR